MDAAAPTIVPLLAGLRRRIRLAWLAAAGQVVLAVCAVAVALASVAAWAVPSRMVGRGAALGALVVAVVCGAAVAVGWRRLRLDDGRVARVADRALGAPDVFAAAVEFGTLAGPLGEEVRRRATTLAASTAPARLVRVPRRWPWLGIATAAVVVAVACSVVDGPADRQRRRDARAAAAAAGEATRLRAAAAELRASGATAAHTQAATVLDGAAATLERTGDLPAVARELRTAAGALDPDPGARLAALAAVKGRERELAARPLATGGTAAAQLEALARELGAGQRADATTAERLDALASAARSTDPALAEQLAKAADAMREGDTAKAAAALQSAATQAKAAADAARDRSQSAEAAAALRRSAEQIDRARDSAATTSSTPGKTRGTIAPKTARSGGGSGNGGPEPSRQPGSANATAGSGGASGLAGDAAGGGAGPGAGTAGGRGSDLQTGPAEGTLPSTAGGDALVPDGKQGNDPVVGLANAPSRVVPATAASVAAVRTAAAAASRALPRSELAPSEERLVRAYFDALASAGNDSGDDQAGTDGNVAP